MLFINVDAQIKKGSVLLGSSLSYQKTTQEFSNPPYKFNYSAFSVSPAIGRAIKENLIVGISINYGNNKNDYSDTNYQKNNSYGIGFFARKYKYLGSNFYLFAQTSFNGNYSSGSGRNFNQYPNKYNSNGFDIALSFYPGVSYAINNKFQIETGFNNLFNVSYSHTKRTDDPSLNYNPYKQNSFSISSSLNNPSNFIIGFRILLNRHKI